MKSFQQILTEWMHVDKPSKEYHPEKPKRQFLIIYMGTGFAIGLITLLFLNWIGGNYWESVESQTQFINYGINGLFTWIFFLTMFIPMLIGNLISLKKKCPPYGFSAIGGFLIASAIYSFLGNRPLAYYSIFVIILLFLLALPSPKDYTLKVWHLVYFIILGAVICDINIYITDFYGEIWCYLQFAWLHLMAIVLIATKIRQWGYFYMIGWSIVAFIYLFLPGELINGIYYIFAPNLLTWAVLRFFFKIWRPASKNINHNSFFPKE